MTPRSAGSTPASAARLIRSARNVLKEETPRHTPSRQTPARQTPARQTPARQTPARSVKKMEVCNVRPILTNVF